MKPVPVSTISFTSSVHVGHNERNFFQAVEVRGGKEYPQYEITIVDMFVRIKCLKTEEVVWSPLFNVRWWKPSAVVEESAPAKAVSSSGIHTGPDGQEKPKAKAKVKL